jgi:hypothetical protein
MPERPIVLFPEPVKADRVPPRNFFQPIHKPSIQRQYDKLFPKFKSIKEAVEQQRLSIQTNIDGIDPDFAVVFETIGSVDNFLTAVRHLDGFEWLFENEIRDLLPDDDFYEIGDNDSKLESALNGRIYCVMSNRQALNELLSMWEKYKEGETGVFRRGHTGFRDIFSNLYDIHLWGPKDRIHETDVLEYWSFQLENESMNEIPFEIELFHRTDSHKRDFAFQKITSAISEMNGQVIAHSTIDEINYDGMLVKLPREKVSLLIERYDEIRLAKIDDIMFFRPSTQTVFRGIRDEIISVEQPESVVNVSDKPIVAIFDGLPIENHSKLKNRLIIDDPDDFARNYEEKHRFHGTAMSSLVIHGDLENNSNPIKSKVYVRPILKPIVYSVDVSDEYVPTDILIVDLIRIATKRMIEGSQEEAPKAPSVKIVNFSIGDSNRVFTTFMSPLARLIDWLSFKYGLLFIISAGNHKSLDLECDFSDFRSMSMDQRNRTVFTFIRNDIRNRKVLSPAESLSCLCVGATFDDNTSAVESDENIFIVDRGLPSPISSFGTGYARSITPDIFFKGGREFVRNHVIDQKPIWRISSREPGCKVAAPSSTNNGLAYEFGTSDAAAQISHEGVRCFETLEDLNIPIDEKEFLIRNAVLIIKAMLVHGASWDNISAKLSRATEDPNNRLSRWVGYGVPDVERVLECTKNRITLIGTGDLKNNEAHVYKLPIPFSFSQLQKRRLTITLAYFPDINSKNQKYRSHQLFFELNQSGKNLLPNRQNADYHSVKRSSLQHEIFTGESALVWDEADNIEIKVNCKELMSSRTDKVKYSIVVTFELAEGTDVDVYSSILSLVKVSEQILVR